MLDNRKIKYGIFFLLLFSYCYVWHKPNWNDLGRYDLIQSIVEQGTVNIDVYHVNTGDKAIFNGHYYSDKAPGPAFLGVPIYRLLNGVQRTFGWGEGGEDWERKIVWFYKLVIIRIVVIGLPSAFLGVLIFEFLSMFGIPARFNFWVTMGYSLGTLAFPYSTLFYGHQFAAVCLFGAFLIIYRYQSSGTLSMNWLLLSGFLSGYAILSEYPVILIAMVITLYFLSVVYPKEGRIKSIVYYSVGIIIPIMILLIYNYLCSGNMFKVGYFHVAGNNFRKEMEHGIAGVTYPKIAALWGITFSPYRGLFLINPFLLFAVVGYYYMYREKKYRKEWVLSLAIVVIFFLFNASYYMWWGGWAIGPRHLVPVLPFFIIPIVFLPKRYWKFVYGFIGISMVFMWIGTMVDPQVPDSAGMPLLDFSIPQLMAGKVSPNFAVTLGFSPLLGVYIFAGILCISLFLLDRRISSVS